MKITLDNSRVAGMAANGTLIAEFPFLTLSIEQKACCGRVTGKTPDYDNIRRSIAGLPDDRKTKLKEMLQTEEITVHYHNGAAVQTVTF